MNSKIFDAAVSELPQVTGFVEEQLEAWDCPMKATMQITVCVEEIFVNIASYAYPAGTGKARLDMDNKDGIISIIFSDSGTPFDPLAVKEPDITLPAEERGVGGLGILMVRKTMDEVAYAFRDGRNILTIKKHI